MLTVSAQTWTFSTEKDGIRVYSSAVADSKVKALKVECEFNTTLSKLVAVLLDVKGCKDWVYHTKSAALIKQVSPSELYYYSEISLPWPVQNRDFVAHLSVHQNPDTKVATMDGPAVPGFVPVKNGIVRIDHSKGKWIMTPLEGGRVKVEYTLHVDPGGAIPAWIVNMLAAEGPIQSFKGLRIQLRKPEYQHPKFDFIED